MPSKVLPEPRAGAGAPGGEREFTILAIDHGERRVGLAIKPAGQAMVLPVGVVANDGGPATLAKLREMIEARGARVVVVGLPISQSMDQARKVRRFARKLREGMTGVRWRFVDETLTSEGAREARREAGLSPKGAVDASAAVLILESYLQRPT